MHRSIPGPQSEFKERKSAQMAKPINRLSERRGLGSLTLQGESIQEENTLPNEKKHNLKKKSCLGGSRKNFLIISEDDASHFRSNRLQDGAETSIVTVEELSRDCPPAGISPASSPSSKYRASLPGCSPRYPHNYHHRTIFSFPSLPSSSVSSLTSYQRRRLFYPFSTVGLLACNRYSASHRLSTVFEKPVGDASIHLAYPIQDCALHDDHNKVLQKLPLDRESLPEQERRNTSFRVLESQSLPILSHAWPLAIPFVNQFEYNSKVQSSPETHSSTKVCHENLPSTLPTVFTSYETIQQKQSGGEKKFNIYRDPYTECSSPCVNVLPSQRNHQQSAYRVDNNRTTDDFCTNRGGVVSLNSNRGFQSKKSFLLASCDCKTHSLPSTVIQKKNSLHFSRPLTESVSDGLICLNTVVQRPQPEKLTSLRTMDRRSHSHSAPAPSLQGTLPMSLGSCATCTSIDGQGVATSQSPSQALSGPIFTTQHYVSCKNHEIACRTCSCEKGQEKSASDIDFPMQTKSQCTSTMTPMTPITTVHTQLPDVKCAQCVAESNKELTTNTQVTAFSEFSCEKSPDIFPLPNRPARSRSPNAVACNSHCVFTELVRDRRACSADRPLCIHYSTAVDSTAKSNDSNFDKIISSSKNVCSTKVEKLRQLTQRLRPSLMPFQSASSASDQMQYSSPVPNSLPPIPIAPPRHPRIRAERKKTSKAKKDSATSTSDLTLPTKLASGATLFDTMTTSVLTSGNCDLNVNVEAATGDDNAALSKLKQHAEESTNKLTDKRELKNDIPHFLNDSTCINLQTSNDNQPPSNSDDFFDEVHLSLSKLNPRIMVGTYQQRTIPFRSASFSQIDVGSDGTYNRRPRTSITLKPVTYSIGKEMTGNSSPLHSASLPRRLKISDCNSEEASNPTANPSELEGNSGISTASKLASSEGQMDSNYNTFEELGGNEETVTAEYKTCIVGDKEMQDTFNQGQLQRTEHAFQSYPTPHQTDSNASTEFVIDHINNLESNSREISNDIETEVSPNCSSLGHSANVTEDEELKLDKTKEESILATYETNEISVSADIRLSPLQNSRKFTETNATISITDPDISANSRPLPVLDLLELNNHLLRLRAATRDGTLDHLADMEVAAQFGESVSLFPPSNDTTCSTTSTKDALKQLSSEESESRPWLNELLRHASFKEDDSAVDSSYENYTAGSSERYNSEHATAYFNATSDITGKFESIYELKDCLKPLTLQSASSTTTLITLPESHCPAPNISDILQSSRNRRRSSKRRRHASWVFSDNSTEQNVLFKNSNRGRSLTFPPACLTISISDLYNTEKDLVMKRKDQVSQWYEESGFKVGKPSSFTRNEIQRAANEHHINKSLTKERVSPNTFPALFEPLYKDTQQSDTCLQTQCSLPAKNQSDHPQACQVSKECVLGKSPSTRLTITSALDEHLVSNNHTNQLPDIGLLVDDKQYISIEPDQSNRCTFRENLVQPHLERENTESNRELTESNIDVNNSSAIVSDEGNRISKAHHRLTVSLSVTLAPELECSDSSSYHNVSLSPYCPDLDSGNFNVSPEKMQKSPANPRRYGLKRRPLRGPYGEMLEAEMNKSEFNKMYAKRSDDLSFLREINPRINRDAKSSSPRPISPQTLNSVHLPTCDSTLPNWASITAVRQISAPLPTSHSMDDSQLKIGYNSSAMPAENSNPLHNPRLALSKRKNSANIPCEQSDNDFKVNDIVTKTDVVSLLPSPTLDDPVKSQILPLVVENTHVINSIPSSSHHRTSSSPCQFVLNEGGFTSEDEPELLELTSLSSLSRSTAHLLNSESPNIDTLRLTRIGSTKRSRVKQKR